MGLKEVRHRRFWHWSLVKIKWMRYNYKNKFIICKVTYKYNASYAINNYKIYQHKLCKTKRDMYNIFISSFLILTYFFFVFHNFMNYVSEVLFSFFWWYRYLSPALRNHSENLLLRLVWIAELSEFNIVAEKLYCSY